ncbi:MAG: PTS sugar transporter subunit IIA [Acetobacteraceae bacterium]|nr:MAG: PTS sugar transporter subunit IIA [Acetobacteraceae bacterium]
MGITDHLSATDVILDLDATNKRAILQRLPHARLEGALPPVALFARLRRPVDFEARDEQPVDLVILVLWPEASPEGFLPALAETCRSLREPQVLRRLRTVKAPEEVVTLLAGPAAPATA